MTPPIRMVSVPVDLAETPSIRNSLGLFRSAILCGEQWSDTCRDAYVAALKELDQLAMLTAAPVREEGGAVQWGWRVRSKPSKTPSHRPWHWQADEPTGITAELCEWEPVYVALATREEAPERRVCDECGFKGTSDDASKEQDYCTACGGNSPSGGPDECAHCGAKNHMVMSCPKCGGRFSLDEDTREEAPTEAGDDPVLRSRVEQTMSALRAQAQAREGECQ